MGLLLHLSCTFSWKILTFFIPTWNHVPGLSFMTQLAYSHANCEWVSWPWPQWMSSFLPVFVREHITLLLFISKNSSRGARRLLPSVCKELAKLFHPFDLSFLDKMSWIMPIPTLNALVSKLFLTFEELLTPLDWQKHTEKMTTRGNLCWVLGMFQALTKCLIDSISVNPFEVGKYYYYSILS